MTWTYSGDPTSTPKDEVRFLVGDTDAEAPLLSDEEIAYLLVGVPSAISCAPKACATILSKLAREVDYTIGPEKVTASQRFENYQKLIPTLRQMWTNASAAPVWQDPNYTTGQSSFDIGMHDYKGGGPSGLPNPETPNS